MPAKIERSIEICPIDAPLVQYLIMSDSDQRKPVGYVLVTVAAQTKKHHLGPYKIACIWHIHVEHGERHKGYAKTLIEALKYTFDELVSQVQTKEGNCLLTGQGFVVEKNKGVEYRIWKK